MRLMEIKAQAEAYPPEIWELLEGARIYDTSSSPEATVIFIDKDDGYFLKSGKPGQLKKEAELWQYFHKRALAPELLAYLSCDKDFLLTRKACGADLTSKIYLDEPKRLAIKMGELLRELHSMNFEDCPEKNRLESYFELLEKNYESGKFDLTFGKFKTKEEAFAIACRGREALKCDTLIHGDFCLPNIIFDNWKFSSFIDLGGAGIGDRHIDIFWGAWTLNFNLKTDEYRDLFLSAYGKDKIDLEALEIVSAIEIFA